MSKASTLFDFSDASVLVTGGTNGIGLCIADAFRLAGARVYITGTRINTDEYNHAISSEFTYFQLDVEDQKQIQAVADAIPAIDILINNAGASLPGGKSEYEPDVFEQSVRINLFSAYHMAYALQPKLAQSGLPGGASIVGIASLTSFFGNAIVPGYGAAKAGLVQLAKTLSIAWAEKNIRVNNVAAGFTETRMTEAVKSIPQINQPMLERTPLKRWGTPQDIANGVLFLCSEQAGFITGETLVIDGGYSIAG